MPGRALAPENLHPLQNGGGNLEMVYWHEGMKIRTWNWCQIYARDKTKRSTSSHYSNTTAMKISKWFVIMTIEFTSTDINQIKSGTKIIWDYFSSYLMQQESPEPVRCIFLTLFKSKGGKCSSLVCFFPIYFQPVYNLCFFYISLLNSFFVLNTHFLKLKLNNWKTKQNHTIKNMPTS